MQTTLLIGHPYDKSFNHVILAKLLERYPSATVINLVTDGFNPAMLADDLALFSKGAYADPLVGKYQQILSQTDKLIIIAPIWWYGLPAIKGFFDKVMLKNFAYTEATGRLVCQLTHIKETVVITTGIAPAIYLRLIAGHPIGALKKRILKDMGLKQVKWFHKGNVTKSAENNKKWLAAVGKKV